MTMVAVYEEETSSDHVLTHDRVRKARHKARHKRVTQIERGLDSVLDNHRKRAQTYRHRNCLSAIALAAGLHQSGQDCPEFWFCQGESTVDVPMTRPGCWTFDYWPDDAVATRSAIAARREALQAEVDELLAETFPDVPIVEMCFRTKEGLYEHFDQDPDSYTRAGYGLRITTRP